MLKQTFDNAGFAGREQEYRRRAKAATRGAHPDYDRLTAIFALFRLRKDEMERLQGVQWGAGDDTAIAAPRRPRWSV